MKPDYMETVLWLIIILIVGYIGYKILFDKLVEGDGVLVCECGPVKGCGEFERYLIVCYDVHCIDKGIYEVDCSDDMINNVVH